MTREELEREQAGMAAESGMSAEKAKNSKATSARLLHYLMKQKAKLLVIVFAAIIGCGLTMASPLIIGKAVDILFNGIQESVVSGVRFEVNVSTLGGIAFTLLVIYLLNAICSYLQQYLMAGISQTLTLSLREKLNRKLTRLPLRYYDNHSRGDIMSRITNDLERVSDTLQQGMMQFITSVINILGAVVIMLIISPILTVITLTTILIGIVITVLVSGKSHGFFMQNQKSLGELNGLIEEFFTGRTVVKAFNRETDAAEAVSKANQKLYAASKKAQFISYAVMPAIRLFNQMGYMLIAVIGAVFVIQGRLSLGIVQAFFQYVNQVSEPITEASYTINTMQAAIASAERVFEILDAPEEEEEVSQPMVLDQPKGEVRFEHVRFGYYDDAILMQDVSINIQAGQKIAIVGPTGAGKTTLINLLMRFYEPQGGKILIDGVDIRKMTRAGLRNLLGMVLQEAWIFGGTMKDNIAYSREKVKDNEIVDAAKAARIDHFIRTLPDGYDTILNEDGSDISQGQRQLITIARAILADPLILILDEATSSVDTRTELEIQKAMDVLMKGRTSFVIAHRLSTILDADCILVMKNGTIIEQGNHLELMQRRGFYADLYSSQFANEAV